MNAFRCYAGFVGMMILGPAIPALGQTPPPAEPPPGPLLAKPNAAHWQVTASAETNATVTAPAHTTVASIKTVTISGDVRYEETKDVSGKELIVTWCQGKNEFYRLSSWNQFFVLSPENLEHYIVNPKQVSPELEWISRADFIGIKQVNGKPCLVFGRSYGTLPPSDSDELLAPEQVDSSYHKKTRLWKLAYISQETRLPVYFQEGAAGYLYQFGAAPDSPLVLPDEIKAMLKMRDDQTKRLSIQPARS